MTADDSVETIGHLAEHHVHQLPTALVAAGAAGVLSVGIIPIDDPDSTATPHRVWPFVRLGLHATAMRIYCVPTGDGTVLLVEGPKRDQSMRTHLGRTDDRVRRRHSRRGPPDDTTLTTNTRSTDVYGTAGSEPRRRRITRNPAPQRGVATQIPAGTSLPVRLVLPAREDAS